jgi:hypothetical protein
LLHTISLNNPNKLCGTSDNGCWIVDNASSVYKAYRYDYDASLQQTVDLDRYVTDICSDLDDGFWYISGSYVYHVNSDGVETCSCLVTDYLSRVHAGYEGCVVWSNVNNSMTHVNSDGVIVNVYNSPGTATEVQPKLLSINYNAWVDLKIDCLPVEYDPVWGTTGSLEWREVKKDGYFLPKYMYHQAKITLRNEDASSTPYLNRINMPPAVRLQDLQPQSSRNVYVKTTIPYDAVVTEYDAKLKCWWRK